LGEIAGGAVRGCGEFKVSPGGKKLEKLPVENVLGEITSGAVRGCGEFEASPGGKKLEKSPVEN